MPTEFMIFQDSDDIGRGVKLDLTEGSGGFNVYFTLTEWQAFKEAVNKFRYIPKGECAGNTEVELKDNPLQCIYQDGKAIGVNFVFGELFAELYFEDPAHWENLKKQVNMLTPI